jgi:hypothetical protein
MRDTSYSNHNRGILRDMFQPITIVTITNKPIITDVSSQLKIL